MQYIPKLIHCVWLSGDEKPQMIKDCLASWKCVMPDYEIKEWSMDDVKDIDSSFLQGAISAKKWAFATDYLRVWILYHYGGIYMDLDMFVYRKFDIFLQHRAFSGIEFWPPLFYKTLKEKKIRGLGVDAAILGAEAKHPWIKDILSFYDEKDFIDDSKFYTNIIMPNVIADVSKKYGFRYIPCFQVLEEEVYLYPHDIFSAVYRKDEFGLNENDYYLYLGEKNVLRHSCHLCANSWGYVPRIPFISRVEFLGKKFILKIFGKKLVHSIRRLFKKKDNSVI